MPSDTHDICGVLTFFMLAVECVVEEWWCSILDELQCLAGPHVMSWEDRGEGLYRVSLSSVIE